MIDKMKNSGIIYPCHCKDVKGILFAMMLGDANARK